MSLARSAVLVVLVLEIQGCDFWRDWKRRAEVRTAVEESAKHLTNIGEAASLIIPSFLHPYSMDFGVHPSVFCNTYELMLGFYCCSS